MHHFVRNLLFLFKKNLDFLMVENGDQTTIDSVNKWTKEVKRNLCVNHVHNHYFLNQKTLSVNWLVIGEQILVVRRVDIYAFILINALQF